MEKFIFSFKDHFRILVTSILEVNKGRYRRTEKSVGWIEKG